jgi:hypothetical protein
MALPDQPHLHLRKIQELLLGGYVQLALLEAVRAVQIALTDFKPGGGITDGDVAATARVLAAFQEKLRAESSG